MALSTTFWIQLLGIIFSVGMSYFTFVRWKRNEISKTEKRIWYSGWVALGLISIYPSIFDFIIGPLNFYRRLDFFVVLGFFVLLGLGFFNYSTVKKLERKLEKYVRKEALEEAPKLK